MKLVYIAGLEHSGTTLINHLLSQHKKALGLGEVASWFDTDHMRQYMEKWGKYSDVRRCSCGKEWGECPFWGEIMNLNGLESRRPLEEKYQDLYSYVEKKYGVESIIIDSSKRYNTMKMLMERSMGSSVGEKDILIVAIFRDVRGFVTSIHRKDGAEKTMLSYWKTMNWWKGENENLLEYLKKSNTTCIPVLYEHLCRNPVSITNNIYEELGLDRVNEIEMGHHQSHIAMGNKSFSIRNKEQVRYDVRWFLEDAVQNMYQLRMKIKNFNKKLYRISSASHG